MTDRPPEPDASLLNDLVATNRVLYAKGIVDGRNLLDREALRRKGFVVLGIGRV